MEKDRISLQGTSNIIRFNWHFYAFAALFVCILLALGQVFLAVLVILPTLLSLGVSMYVYDFSDLYRLHFLPHDSPLRIINIHAGFDETSHLLQERYPNSVFQVLDFYDPQKHTEISIKRARAAYPAYPNTRSISTEDIGLSEGSLDRIFLIFAAHEIRAEAERIAFFQNLAQALKISKGEIYVLEHLRDLPNFIAYNIGFFHFLSRKTWLTTFKKAHLQVKEERKINLFVRLFILECYIQEYKKP